VLLKQGLSMVLNSRLIHSHVFPGSMTLGGKGVRQEPR